MDWSQVKYFKPHEFDSPDAPGSGSKMNLEFVLKLDALREAVKSPLAIHSGFRTSDHNATVGGVDSSAHETGHAADIAALSSRGKFEIIEAALRIGFRRVGIGNTFIHLDDDLTKDQSVCWVYPSTAKRT